VTATPTNDGAGGARRLSGRSGTVSGSTLGATGEADFLTDASVWFSWVAPSSGVLSVSSSRSAFTSQLALLSNGKLARFSQRSFTPDADVAQGPCSEATCVEVRHECPPLTAAMLCA
jgi:hypothetical protein